MNLETIALSEIPTEVICALITFTGVIIGNISSRSIAKDTAKRETERLKQEWEHNEQLAFNNAFHDMTQAVSAYISDSSMTKQMDARTKTAVMLTYAEGDLADKIELLYACLKCRPALDADEKLHEAVLSLRQTRSSTTQKKKGLFNFLRRAIS